MHFFLYTRPDLARSCLCGPPLVKYNSGYRERQSGLRKTTQASACTGEEEQMDTAQATGASTPRIPEHTSYTLWKLVRYFLRLGTLGFGGPVALVGYMHRDLVEQRVWIAEADYQEGLALARLS